MERNKEEDEKVPRGRVGMKYGDYKSKDFLLTAFYTTNTIMNYTSTLLTYIYPLIDSR